MPAIGIDLGTFNSAAAIIRGRGNSEMIESSEGIAAYGKNFPSFVRFNHLGELQEVGLNAQRSLRNNPSLVVWGVKRFIGLPYQKAKESGELDRFQYGISEDIDGKIAINIGQRVYSPTEILTMIMEKIKSDAETLPANEIRTTIDQAVVTVPAYFDGSRVAEVKSAAYEAGFKEVKIIAEPTAAAIAYGYEVSQEEQIVLTFDIGAGTLDLVIVGLSKLFSENISPIELFITGHEALGGIDMDDAIIDFLINKYRIQAIKDDPRAMAIFRDEVERAKVALSNDISRPSILFSLATHQGKFNLELKQAELKEALEKPPYKILERIRKCLEYTLSVALNHGCSPERINHILFIGGPTHMPIIRNLIKEYFQGNSAVLQEMAQIDQQDFSIDPLEAVARGAAVYASGQVDPLTISAFGYGTRVKRNYYCEMIPLGASFGTSEPCGFVHQNPQSLVIPFFVYKKWVDPQESGKVKYTHLGDCYLPITPKEGRPEFMVLMELTNDRELLVTMEQNGDRESRLTFKCLESISGKEEQLTEDDDQPTMEDIMMGQMSNPSSFKASWTKEQLLRSQIAGQALLLVTKEILEKENIEQELRDEISIKYSELSNLLDDQSSDPNHLCPKIIARAMEISNRLFAARIIDDQIYQFHISGLRSIGQR